MNATARKTLVAVALVAAWLALAMWQYREFGNQRDRERANLVEHSHVLRHALLGGVRAYRRLGRVFEEQMRAVLDEVAATPGVLAVRLEDEDNVVSLSAGEDDLFKSSEESPLWLPQGLQTSERSDLRFLPPGQGYGGGPGWMRDQTDSGEPLRLQILLLLDRTATDTAVAAAANLRITIVAAGAALLAALGMAWFAGVRAIQARAQADLLQAERDRLEELSQAASGLAHETRNPLGVIRGGLQKMLRNGAASQAGSDRPQLKLLVEECDRVTSRINQFLAYARPQSAEMTPVDVCQVAEELRVLLQPDLEAKQLDLQIRAEQGAEAVVADANLLRQILFNLLQNAITFSPSREAIEVAVGKRQAGDIEIRVADRGPGATEDEVAQLFSPYFTTRADGAGLGLAIVRRLATEQGWSVRYEGRAPRGSQFVIEGIRVAAEPTNPDR